MALFDKILKKIFYNSCLKYRRIARHQESYVRQTVPSQCLAHPMAMPLAIVRSWGEQAVSIMGQTSRCCMVCLMPVTGFLFVGKSPLQHVHSWPANLCVQPVECLPGCPGFLCASWEVFASTDVKVHTGVQGLESLSTAPSGQLSPSWAQCLWWSFSEIWGVAPLRDVHWVGAFRP